MSGTFHLNGFQQALFFPSLGTQNLVPYNNNLALLQQVRNNQLALQQRNLQNFQNLLLLKQREENYNLYLKAQSLHTQRLNILKQQQEAFSSEDNSPLMTKLKKKDYFSSPSSIGELPRQNSSESLQEAVISMVNFFVYEFGRSNTSAISEQRNKYVYNKVLLELFDILTKKYQNSSKCREDMIRFVLRKALGWMRDSIRDKKLLSAKAASIELCQKYFKHQLEELVQNNINVEDEDAVLSFLLPYKRKSRNKTANACFITEIFSSELFYQDYLCFLGQFDKILEDDNQKKIQRLVGFLMDCVKENRLSKIASYKRLPWLKTWLYSTNIIANELLSIKPRLNSSKKETVGKKQKI